MEVARKVKIYLLHGQHLGIATTRSTTLHTEAGTQRRFAQGHRCVLANLIQSQRQTDTDSRLTNTCFRWTNSGNQNQVTLLYFLLVNQRDRHLGHVSSIGFNLFCGDTKTGSYFTDVIKLTFACNLYICLHC